VGSGARFSTVFNAVVWMLMASLAIRKLDIFQNRSHVGAVNGMTVII
jgi:hypothetical protein